MRMYTDTHMPTYQLKTREKLIRHIYHMIEYQKKEVGINGPCRNKKKRLRKELKECAQITRNLKKKLTHPM